MKCYTFVDYVLYGNICSSFLHHFYHQICGARGCLNVFQALLSDLSKSGNKILRCHLNLQNISKQRNEYLFYF